MKEVKLSHSLVKWPGWKESLLSMKRYSKFSVMHYRTDLWIHAHRVRAIVMDLIPYAEACGIEIDKRKLWFMAPHHDDHETVSLRGDVSLQLKLDMTPEERADLEKEEYEAIEKLIALYPRRVGGYAYGDLLRECIRKDTPEAQLLSFADKNDGQFEAVHEILAGNIFFVEPVINYERKTFAREKLREKYPLIAPLFSHEACPYNHHETVSLGELAADPFFGEYHTPFSLKRRTGILFYERIKDLTMRDFGVHILIEAKEHKTPQRKSVMQPLNRTGTV